MSTADLVIKLIPAFITLVVGVVASYISHLQYKINKEKMRLDLFQRRLDAYEKLQQFLSKIMRNNDIAKADLPLLTEARYKARFIFGNEITEYLDEIWERSFEILSQQRKLDGDKSLPTGDERNKVCDENAESIEWMIAQMGVSWKYYRKYLTFVLK